MSVLTDVRATDGWSVLPADAVLRELGSSPDGLGRAEADARLRRYGPNRLPVAEGRGPLRELLAQMVHFFAVLLWIASALAFVAGMPQLGWAIVVVVLVNGAFSFAQEYRAGRAAHALARLLPDEATVLRDGRKVSVPAAALVPGDVVLLREGDRISADARVLRSDGMHVDRSSLTGESEPVPVGAEPDDAAPRDALDASNLVFAGSFVTSGSALAAVVATGVSTRLGGISTLTATVRRRPTPLHVGLSRSVRTIAVLAVASGVVFTAASLWRGTPVRAAFLFGVGVIVALVPEGLLPTLTLSLAVGATRMAHGGALVRHLESVETLGSTTVICTDKTGTLTTNQMTARAIWSNGRFYRTSRTGYDPGGTILSHGHPLHPADLATLGPLLRAAALCGDARVVPSGAGWTCTGDPTEAALVVLAAKGGVDRAAAGRAAPRVREFPFDSRRRLMSTVHALSDGRFEVLAKGSPEAVAAVTGMSGDAVFEAAVERLADEGLRVLAFAHRGADRLPATAREAESGLAFAGLAGLEDPVRPEVPDAVARCRAAGIRVVMVTGDHPATASSVARKAGLAAGTVLTGGLLPDDDGALAALLAEPDVTVLARIAPEQKLRVAAALQSRGEVVAMTGDGVNDAPALRRADIGVAMGRSGTDVAREAADLVLLDDNFAHIVQAVESGRAAFDNTRRFLTYHLTDNVAELAPFVAWALSGGRIPLAITVLQILAIDIGTDLLPALALGAERPDPDAMRRPPRRRGARLLDGRVLSRAFGFLGPVEAAVALSMLAIGPALFGDAGLPVLSTMVFSSIVAMQIANAFACRSTRASLFAIGPLSNRLLAGAVAVEAAALAAFVYLPPLARLLGHRPLAAVQWLPVLAAPFVLLASEEARKAIVRRWKEAWL